MNKVRGFETISSFDLDPPVLPIRKTTGSAGYDICSAYDYCIQPGMTAKVETGIKAYMQPDEVLEVYIRSSLAKQGLSLSNSVGIIDSDYYNNKDNEGHIMLLVHNNSNAEITIHSGMPIAQGVFKKYLVADGDSVSDVRVGGFGSTNY